MRNFIRLCAFLLFIFTAVPDSRADLLDLLVGDTVDDTINEMEFLLENLEEAVDALGEKYSDRLEEIVSNSILLASEQADDLRESIRRDLFELKGEVFNDIAATIWEAECAAVRLAEGTFQESLRAAVMRLVESDPAVNVDLFGFEIVRIAGSADPNAVAVPRPDIVYYRFRDAAIKALAARYQRDGPTTPAFAIYSTLLEISQLARQTSCRFPGNQSAEERFMGEHARFGARAALWDNIVSVQFAE